MTKPAVRWAWRRTVIARATDETRATAHRRAIVVAPHPDDETLGCGATIARKRAAGTDVTVVVVTDGRHSHRSRLVSPAELAAVREREVRQACSRLGVDPSRVHLLGFEEGSLPAHREALVRRVSEIVEETAPDEVLTTCAADWHVDHQEVSSATRAAVAAAGRRPRLLEFPVWYWVDGPWRLGAGERQRLGRFLADPVRAARLRAVTVRTGGHLATKRAALAHYRSQTVNLTGEADWAVMGDDLLSLFLGEVEVFLPVEPTPRP